MLDAVRSGEHLPHIAVTQWLERFENSIIDRDATRLAALFAPGAYWRDVLAFTWHFRTMSGAGEIARLLCAEAEKLSPRNFRLADRRVEPRRVSRAGVDTLEAIFNFETDIGNASGVLRLVPDERDPASLVAWTIMTNLEELSGFESPKGRRVARGFDNLREFGGENWLDKRIKTEAFEDRDPTVLVIGAGHAGLGVAARLGQLGVDTLVVDREERIGDNWRNRYHSLTLHNEIWVNHLPYMPFPSNWPTYIPKDKLANWLECYVESMELNVWTETEFVSGTYDFEAERWTAVIRGNGVERTMHPRHIVFATGVSGIANMPDIPGLHSFAGTVVHSSRFTAGEEWAGKTAIVIGTGNSSHDVAQELHSSGAKVTMVQRGSTQVVSMAASAEYTFPLYREDLSTEDADTIAMGMPFALYKRGCQMATDAIRAADTKLLQDLSGIGFKLDEGLDGTGYLMSYLRRGGGYYFNVGCSDLLISGKMGLVQYETIDRFDETGAKLKNGGHVEADLVVLGTGYQPQSALVTKLLGQEVSDRVGEIWDFDKGGEVRNIWKCTGQPGLWFAAGSLAQCRTFSRILALQIKARELGIVPRNSRPGELAAK